MNLTIEQIKSLIELNKINLKAFVEANDAEYIVKATNNIKFFTELLIRKFPHHRDEE